MDLIGMMPYRIFNGNDYAAAAGGGAAGFS